MPISDEEQLNNEAYKRVMKSIKEDPEKWELISENLCLGGIAFTVFTKNNMGQYKCKIILTKDCEKVYIYMNMTEEDNEICSGLIRTKIKSRELERKKRWFVESILNESLK